MPPKRHAIEEKFMFYVVMEMRRQGVPNVAEWQSKLEGGMQVFPRKIKVAENQPSIKVTLFVVNMTGMEVNDKVAIAMTETFVKMQLIQAQFQDIDEWRFILRNNHLTDLAVTHLALLLDVCPRMTKIDVRGNALSEEKRLELLRCAERSDSFCAIAFNDFESEKYKELASHLNEQRAKSGSTEAVRRSVSAVSSSVASRVSFASGGPEALRKRREELFSKNKRKKMPSNTATGESEEDELTHASNQNDRNNTSLEVQEINISNIEADRDQNEVVTPRESAAHPLYKPEEEDQRSAQEDSPPPRERRKTVSPSAARESDNEPFLEGNSPLPNFDRNKGKNRNTATNIPRSREPFEEKEDFLDVTSNLNPILDSVLDLSGVAENNGELQHPMIFGGARRVWEVVAAYETAVERSGQGSAIDPDTSAKLPSALIGGDNYNALTVLNLSNNQLRVIEVLPKSLLRIDISSNLLTSLEGLGQCKMLTVVNARRNQISEISGLERNRCIAHLFLGRNQIKMVQGLAHLLLLETLDLTHNRLKTQGSIRALSLCSSLRHLLLKGNAVLDTMKGRHVPVLRNLCPTLLVIDDTRVAGNSRSADVLLSQRNAMRQPNQIKNTYQPNIQDASLVERRVRAEAQKDINNISVDSGSNVSYGAPSSSANALHMLTQGVTAPTGYGDGVKAMQGARQISKLARQKEEEENKKKRARLTEGGKNIRKEILKQLAEESQKYLENTIVERLIQQEGHNSNSINNNDADVDDGRNMKQGPNNYAKGSSFVSPPGHHTSSMNANLSANDQELLKRYEPTKFKPPHLQANKTKKIAGKKPQHSVKEEEPYEEEVFEPQQSKVGGKSGYADIFAEERLGSHSPPNRNYPNTDECDEEVEGEAIGDASPPVVYPGRAGSPATTASRSRTREGHPRSPSNGTVPGGGGSDVKSYGLRRSESLNTHRSPRQVSVHEEPMEEAATPSATSLRGSASPPRGDATGTKAKNVVRRDPQLGDWPPAKRTTTSVPTNTYSNYSGGYSNKNNNNAHADPYRESQAAHDLHPPPPLANNRATASKAPSTRPKADANIPKYALMQDVKQNKIVSWRSTLNNEFEAVQDSLRTLVTLLQAHRVRGCEVPERSSDLPKTYQEERQKCVGMISRSGLLEDTRVPMEVVAHYNFKRSELDAESGRGSSYHDTENNNNNVTPWTPELSEREEVLRRIRMMGDAKTCLRYLVLLINEGRERAMQEYVDQVLQHL